MKRLFVMAKKLYIIAGHNGAGKTTFLKEFIKNKNLKYIEVDEIARGIAIDKFSLLSIRAGKIALRHIEKFKKEKMSFAVETTLSGKTWKKIIKDFKKSDYYVTIFFIYLDTPEEALKRIAVRINKKGHYISEDVVYRRYFRSIKNFWLTYKNLSQRWFLINNSSDTPFLVAHGEGKDYKLIDKDNFEKFLSIVKRRKGEK